ncbi:MAG: insulinase family protein [Ignavibacteriales bacterium]|jgi:zinc protease|nr:insulinase family protein [Ignavibacteriales bacterium]MBK8660338.1 insulinase family protein [Ignavibacteriales bacterium]MBP9122484.1 insulinase family protein [Ignavibacteriaceae bacterium]MCC6636978.1 insulinase family protein [Ignavibacteriaceae bacterium]
MTRYSIIKLVLIVLIMTTTDISAGGVFPYKVHRVNLNNGFKALLIPMPGSGLVSYYTVVRTGSRDEWEPGKSGFAHFFEHMMFRGTNKYPLYDSVTTTIGADANAYTDDDLTVYHLNFAAEDLDKVMDLESDRFRNLNYPKDQFMTESGAVYGEYRKSVTNPFSVLFEKFQDMAFDKHTYKHTTIGFEADIKDMPNQYEYSLSFYNRYYRPENCVLVIAGDFDPEKVSKMVEDYYSPWKPGYVSPKIEPEPKQTAPREAKIKYDGKTLPLVAIGYKYDAFNVYNKDFMAMLPFADLAFGETSELYKKLVLDEQKVQFVSAGAQTKRDPFPFMIYSRVKAESDMDYVISEIEKTIEHFKNNLVSKEQLDNLKKRMKYQFLMGLDSPESVASVLPMFITLTGDIEVLDEYFIQMMDITPEDIQRAVKKYFVKESRNQVILTGN